MRAPAIVVFRAALVLQFALGLTGALHARGLHMRPTSSLPLEVAIPFDLFLWALDLAVLAGMWYFWRWARTFYIAQTALLLIALVLRPQPIVGYSNFFALGMLQNILAGVAIAMAFLPPIAGRFATERPNQAMQRTAPRSDA